MEKDNSIYLEHITRSISAILEYTDDLSETDFASNRLVQDAVLRQFQVMGEATKRLSKEFRSQHPHVRWAHIAGMRDVLIHDYFQIDLTTVWKTVQDDLPLLQTQIEELL